LVLYNNALYGITDYIGLPPGGALFRIGTDGSDYTVLHSFGAGSDGSTPCALALSGSVLHGVTKGGGAYARGTAFSIDTSGANYAIDHDFAGSPNDAEWPNAAVWTGSAFYGMTTLGGSHDLGTIFALPL
jgi:uncharacterized repeat protein (TIGR03803 family)